MNDYKTLEKRYFEDPIFHKVVSSMYYLIDTLSLTPGELRECVMFACMQHEMLNPNRMIIAESLKRDDSE